MQVLLKLAPYLERALFVAAAAYSILHDRWSAVAVLLVVAVALEVRAFTNLRKEKIHDADRKNLAAIAEQVNEFRTKLNALHGQVFKNRIGGASP